MKHRNKRVYNIIDETNLTEPYDFDNNLYFCSLFFPFSVYFAVFASFRWTKLHISAPVHNGLWTRLMRFSSLHMAAPVYKGLGGGWLM